MISLLIEFGGFSNTERKSESTTDVLRDGRQHCGRILSKHLPSIVEPTSVDNIVQQDERISKTYVPPLCSVTNSKLSSVIMALRSKCKYPMREQRHDQRLANGF
jgi:hypothetical protein